MLSDRAANSDTTDVLRGSGNHPQLSEWRKPWELASAAYFNRQHRVLWWRILHGCVMCGAKQLPEVTVVRLHNVPGGINVHGLMACLLEHFQFGPEYSVVSEFGGDVSGDIAAVTPAWCRSDVCIAELKAPVQDAKLSQLPAVFTCFGQQVSVSVQPSLLAKAHLYQRRVQAQQPAQQPPSLQSPRHKRRQSQKARAKKAASQPSHQHQQQLQSLQTTFCPAVSADGDLGSQGRVALTRPLDLAPLCWLAANVDILAVRAPKWASLVPL